MISWPVVDFLSFLIVGIFLIREIRIINKNIEIEKIKI